MVRRTFRPHSTHSSMQHVQPGGFVAEVHQQSDLAFDLYTKSMQLPSQESAKRDFNVCSCPNLLKNASNTTGEIGNAHYIYHHLVPVHTTPNHSTIQCRKVKLRLVLTMLSLSKWLANKCGCDVILGEL